MPVNFGIYDENYLAVLKDDYLAQRLAKSDDIPYQVVDFEELLKHQQSKLIVICDPKDMPTIVKHGQLFSHPAVKSLQAGKLNMNICILNFLKVMASICYVLGIRLK